MKDNTIKLNESVIRRLVAESLKSVLNEVMQIPQGGQIQQGGQMPQGGQMQQGGQMSQRKQVPSQNDVKKFNEGFVGFLKMGEAPKNFNELYKKAIWYSQQSYPQLDAEAMVEMWTDSYGGSKGVLNAITPLCRKAPQMQTAKPSAKPSVNQQQRQPLRSPEKELEMWQAYHGKGVPYGKSSNDPYAPVHTTSYLPSR